MHGEMTQFRARVGGCLVTVLIAESKIHAHRNRTRAPNSDDDIMGAEISLN